MKTTKETIDKIEKQIFNDFNLYKRNGNKFRICIDVDSKVNKIERLKDYLNTNIEDFSITIGFGGGLYWQKYTTILNLTIIE